ncbi:hypothetical protein PoB_007536800 [Plakobranchus ocellatus]|uniref:Uncharacterized protein n=1 Tax=Plakobranchus ocellatus TaxID=259542 RepID=A0AAV4DXM9_9GAST|nr:hypothetical protein PoB_007536800 [Plakobranchus ocellatus]
MPVLARTYAEWPLSSHLACTIPDQSLLSPDQTQTPSSAVRENPTDDSLGLSRPTKLPEILFWSFLELAQAEMKKTDRMILSKFGSRVIRSITFTSVVE